VESCRDHMPTKLHAAAAAALFLLLVPSTSTTCNVSGWPSANTVNSWRYNGAREKCFCAYSQLSSTPPTPAEMKVLEEGCPDWKLYVSTDNDTTNKVHHYPSSTILGSKTSNSSTGRYGNILDWSIDFGSGFGNDCNVTVQPSCKPVGSHVLSIPNDVFFQDCCSMGGSVKSLANEMVRNPLKVCHILSDMLNGSIRIVNDLHMYHNCNLENQDPTHVNQCVSQCFHYRPDVNWVHLHTTSGVMAMRDGPIDSGLGPGYNSTEQNDASAAFGRYNVCACEPESWKTVSSSKGSSRGNCPSSKPSDKNYVAEATISLCQNVAAVSGLDSSICQQCASLNIFEKMSSKMKNM
jgi:hypothetical protein